MKPSPAIPAMAVICALLVVCLFIFELITPRGLEAEQGIDTDGLFEFGDGLDPLIPGVADIEGSELAGPDWADLFNADRSLRDAFDEVGNPVANGVPDFLEGYGPLSLRRDAAFVLDDVSAGQAVDATALLGADLVGPSVVSAADDLGNAYAYGAFNSQLESVLYLGAERLASADGSLQFELNRLPFQVDPDGVIVGQRTVGDLLVRVDFAAGTPTLVEIESWELVDAEEGIFSWMVVESLPGLPGEPAEQCNLQSTVCIVSNSIAVDGGAWTSFDSDGLPVEQVAADHFLEIGLNLTRLLGLHDYDNYYDSRYTGIQILTATDYASATFARAARMQVGS